MDSGFTGTVIVSPVILAFCVLVLLSAQAYDVDDFGNNIFVHLRNVIQDNYQGYSYSISLSDTPIHDNLGEYLIDSGVVNPINPHDMIDKIKGYTTFPDLEAFPSDMPNSASARMDRKVLCTRCWANRSSTNVNPDTTARMSAENPTPAMP